jgi:endonuclease/exonuclease/phosphatase (EEP) superfamily protein YafD
MLAFMPTHDRVRGSLRRVGWASVAVAVPGLLRFKNGGFQPLVVAASFAPYCVVPAVAGTGLLASTRSRLGTSAGIALAALLVRSQAPLYRAQQPSDGPGISLALLSGNLRRGQADAARIVALARAERVDVVALQELTPEAVERLTSSGMDEVFPFSKLAPAPLGAGVGLWSRHPITAGHAHTGFRLGVVSGTVTLGSGDESRSITLLSSHLVAPWPHDSSSWSDEIGRLGKLLDSLPGPIAAAGDFNATLDHAQFRHLLRTSGFSDGAGQSGAGLLRSYPADAWYPPVIGIDHVLTREATATRMKTISLPGSDHRGVIAHVSIPR